MEERARDIIHNRQEVTVIFKSYHTKYNLRAGARHAATAEETPPSKQVM